MMTDRTDGTSIDAILGTDTELFGDFEFDNCGLDSIEDLLDSIDEADLYENVLSLPPCGSLTDVSTSDFRLNLPNVFHGTTVPPSLAPSSQTLARSTRCPVGQTQQGHDGQFADVKDGVAVRCRTSLSGINNGHELPNFKASGGNRHRPPMAPGTSVELQTYVDNSQTYGSVLNFSRFQDKSAETLGLNNPRPDHPLHPSHGIQQADFQCINACMIHQRIQGSCPQNDLHAQNRLSAAGHFRSDSRPSDFGSLFSEDVADDILENIMRDNEEVRRFLGQVVCSDRGQLHQMPNSGSDGQLRHGQNQQFPTSSANTGMQNGVHAKSCPDTPPESGSEAHSPPDNLHSMAPDVSSHGDVQKGSFSKASVAPGVRSALPSYHSDHLNSPGNIAGRNKASPGFLDVVANQPAPTMLDPKRLLNECARDSLNHKNKKRKHSLSPQSSIRSNVTNAPTINTISANMPIKPVGCEPGNLPVKPEPVMVSDGSEDDMCGSENPVDGVNGSCQVIKWTNHKTAEWSNLVDDSGKNFAVMTYRVDADKGFNFSSYDEAFICQKKNHFQVTVHVAFSTFPKYIRSADNDFKKIDDFYLHFHGIKMESPNQQIKIGQSQSDRSKRPLHPVRIDFGSPPQLATKAVIGRLHFSETTNNNMRKRGRPNPDQRFFQLVVSLVARCGSKDLLVAAQVSERIIVRASNPGQFDGDVESSWNKGKSTDSICHMGNVGINIENPDEALTVHGNIKLTGHVIAPSDVRAKTDLKQLDTSQQLKNISQINVYRYRFNEKFAKYAGLDSDAQTDTGVLAQEVSEILPDAVQEVDDVVLPDGERIEKFLVVNKDRIFIEGIGAVKELCKVTDKLEDRINEIEIMNKRLKKYGYDRESIKSTSSVRSNVSACTRVSRSAEASRKPNSSQPSDTHSSSHDHHHHCHHHRHHQNSEEISQKDEKSLCSTRFVRVVIVILVLIMALCLAAITTWIIIRDNLAIDEDDIVNPSPPPPPPGDGNYSAITDATMETLYWIDTTETMYETSVAHQGGQPLLWPLCTPEDCPVVQCCMPETSTDMSYTSDNSHLFVSTMTTLSSNDEETTNSIPVLPSTPSALPRGFTFTDASAKDTSSTSSKDKYVVPLNIQNTEADRTNSLSTSTDLKSSRSAGTVTMPLPTQIKRDLFYSSDRTGPPGGPSISSAFISTTPGAAGETGSRPGSLVPPGGQSGPAHPPSQRRQPSPPVPSSAPDSSSDANAGFLDSHPEVVEPVSPGNWRSRFSRKYLGTLEHSAMSRPSRTSSKAEILRPSTASSSTSESTTSNKIKLSSVLNPYSTNDIVSQSPSSVFQATLDEGHDGPANRKRRFVDLPPQPPLADIFIKLGNETRNLTTDYCSDDDCRMRQGTRLFYEILLGSTFPWVPVQIEFVVNSDNVEVMLCNSSFTWNCNSTESDEIITEVEDSLNEWLLPVGMFLRSAYIFRIPSVKEISDGVCQEEFFKAGKKFREYIITFARECSAVH